MGEAEVKETIYICPDDCVYNATEEGCLNKNLPDNVTLECEGDFPQCPLYVSAVTNATRDLAEFLKLHNLEVDYCEADWRDAQELAEGVHKLCLDHPGWAMYYFGGDTWGIDSNFVFFTSREVEGEVVEKIGDFVSMGAELSEKVVPPKPVCPKCGEEIELLIGYYPATVVGYVALNRDATRDVLDYWLDGDMNDPKDIIDTEGVRWCCPACNQELFMAGEEHEDDIMALLKCRLPDEPQYGTWSICSCTHIAQEHDKTGRCEAAGCTCRKYDGVCIGY